jgi:predicted kinase
MKKSRIVEIINEEIDKLIAEGVCESCGVPCGEGGLCESCGAKHESVNEANKKAIELAKKTKITNPETGNKVQVATALANDEHPAHKKAKGMFAKIMSKVKDVGTTVMGDLKSSEKVTNTIKDAAKSVTTKTSKQLGIPYHKTPGDAQKALMSLADEVGKREGKISRDDYFDIAKKMGYDWLGKKLLSHSYSPKIDRNESVNEEVLTEGVNDPGILKAIFLAGGPGSGKSFAVQNVLGVPLDIMKGVSTLGLKVINSDAAFERNLKSAGIDPKTLDKLPQDVFDKLTKGSESAREKAKVTTKKLQKMFERERLGMIIDGTGHDYGKIATMKKRLEELGYDTAMLFVNTRLEIAKERNSQRERVVPEKILVKSWNDVQDNIGKFQSLFGNDFKIIDNNDKVPGKTSGEVTYNFDKLNKDKVSHLKKMANKPIKNPIGKKWIETEKKLRNITK